MAGIKQLKSISQANQQASKTMDHLREFVKPIVSSQIIDGVLLRNVSLVTGQINNVNHGLGRAPLGWIVVGQRSNAVVWDSQALNQFPAKTLALDCSGNVVVDLWIF